MCALFGGKRDISLFRKINRELMGDIITQQCAFYKINLKETKSNIYGESAHEKYYMGPVLLNCLIERRDQEYTSTDLGVDFNWGANFRLLRDDLVDANLVPEIGDIILYQEGYYEVDNIITNQLFVGKNPNYPNEPNPLNPDLENFGYNVSIICQTHYVPGDKVGINLDKVRII